MNAAGLWKTNHWVKHDEGVGGVFRFFKSDGGYDTHVILLFQGSR